MLIKRIFLLGLLSFLLSACMPANVDQYPLTSSVANSGFVLLPFEAGHWIPGAPTGEKVGYVLYLRGIDTEDQYRVTVRNSMKSSLKLLELSEGDYEIYAFSLESYVSNYRANAEQIKFSDPIEFSVLADHTTLAPQAFWMYWQPVTNGARAQLSAREINKEIWANTEIRDADYSWHQFALEHVADYINWWDSGKIVDNEYAMYSAM